jgi:uncharacterized protein (TIGR03437 family)
MAIEERTQAGGQTSEGIDAVHKILERIQSMSKLSANKILLATSALLLCAGFAQAQAPPVSPLTAAPTSVSITFALPNVPGAAVPVVLTVHAGADPFVVNPTTVPPWLSISDTADTAVPAPGVTTNFQASAIAAGLIPGAYTAAVHFSVNGFQDLVVPVTLTVSGAPSTLSVLNGANPVANAGAPVVVPYTYGAAAPTVALTLLSSNDPIEFTAVSTVNGTSTEDWIKVSSASGIAYNYGTGLTISFAQDALNNAAVGSTLTGFVTISYNATTYVVNLSITVGEPLPTVTSIFPKEAPPQGFGGLTVVVTGTGFGTLGQGFTSATQVLINYGTVVVPVDLTTIVSSVGNVHGAVTVVNPTTMILTIPWEDATPVDILDTAQPITISITNNLAGENNPVTATLNITSNPIIYTITDAAALEEPAPGASPSVAPYEMITIWGNNFCPTCAAPVVGTLASSRYPTTLTAAGNPLTVTFYKSDGVTVVGDAYLLFANNTQINAMVPSTVVAADNPMKVVVSYNGVLSNVNTAYTADAVVAKPGIFTTSSTGQGQGAILLSNFSVNSAANKAAPGSTVVIYLSGMGIPNSTAANTVSASAAKFATSCISVASYVTAAGLANPATADGAVLNGADIQTNRLPPCFATANQVTATIGGAAATVTYAGWVSGSVTGLYQVNATVPTKATAGNLPVLVTIGGVTSQAGVTVAVN